MNKKLLVLTLLFLITKTSWGQIKTEIDNGIFVNFPSKPEYKTTTQSSSYTFKSENCIFMALILRNAIPNYAEFVKAKKTWSESEYKKVADAFLDNTVKGKLGYTNNTGQVIETKMGEFYGRKISYSAINPTTGTRGKRFSIIYLVRDKLISFEVWYTNDISASNTEKDNFLNSINTK